MGLTRLDYDSPSWGWLGGSFDPPHQGHLALAHAAKLALGLDQLRFMPTGQSWQKQSEQADSRQKRPDTQQRLEMLKRLIPLEDRAHFDIDTREIERFAATHTPTYTIDTLKELERQHADKRRILILGADQLRNLASWKSYQELLNHTHLAVTTRPGFGLQDLPAPVEALVRDFGSDSLPWTSHGRIVFFAMSPVPMSSTLLRTELAAVQTLSADRLGASFEAATLERFLGKPLLDYILDQGLYRPAGLNSRIDP